MTGVARRCLAGLLLWGMACGAGAESAQPGEQLEAVQQELRRVQDWLKNARREQGSLMNTLRRNESEIGRLEREQRQTESRLKKLRQEHRQASRALEALQARVQIQRDAIAAQLRARYIAGRSGHLRLVLNQQQPDQIARVARYYEYVQKARLGRIEEYLTLADEARRQEEQLAGQRAAVERAVRQLQTQKQSLASSREARLLTLSKLNAGIQSHDEKARRLEQDRAHLEKLLEEVLKGMPELALERQEVPFASQRGKLPWPARGRVQNTFGSNAARLALHRNGLKIRSDTGREVRAVHSGHVVFADWMRRFGLLIIVDHGQGYMSLYGHNESLLKAAGEWVAPGEAIALVGNSGGQDGSALYFELRENGKPVDPRKWLSAKR